MLLYERITFLLVTGTFGLFILAFIAGGLGAFLTLNPGFLPSVARRFAELRSMLAEAQERIVAAYAAFRSGRQAFRSRSA
ncbi:MAG: hypothetical protein JWL88_831 [Parcubacteria group bacterium]|nr:hypothetical protein [Parcubacteria group bacterium]